MNWNTSTIENLRRVFTDGFDARDIAEPVELRRGSYLNLPAHAKHRVVWSDPNEKTVWLAIHYKD